MLIVVRILFTHKVKCVKKKYQNNNGWDLECIFGPTSFTLLKQHDIQKRRNNLKPALDTVHIYFCRFMLWDILSTHLLNKDWDGIIFLLYQYIYLFILKKFFIIHSRCLEDNDIENNNNLDQLFFC